MAQNAIGPIFGNQGIITQGQQGNNTIIQGPVARHIDSPNAQGLKAQILRDFPRDKSVTVTAILGDSEAIQFAIEIHNFMKSNGFLMKEPGGISQAVFTGVVKGLQRQDQPNGDINFIVGSNVQ